MVDKSGRKTIYNAGNGMKPIYYCNTGPCKGKKCQIAMVCKGGTFPSWHHRMKLPGEDSNVVYRVRCYKESHSKCINPMPKGRRLQ